MTKNDVPDWASWQVFLVSTWAITFANHPTSLGLFFFHPILQSLAIAAFTYGRSLLTFVSAGTSCRPFSAHAGILTLQPTSQARTKAAGLTRHQVVILALGVPAISVGTFAIYYRKSLHDHPHFTTWHGVSHLALRSTSATLRLS